MNSDLSSIAMVFSYVIYPISDGFKFAGQHPRALCIYAWLRPVWRVLHHCQGRLDQVVLQQQTCGALPVAIVCSGTIPDKTTCSTWEAALYAAVLYQTRLPAVYGGCIVCSGTVRCTTQDYMQYMGGCIVCSGTVPGKTTCSTWEAALYAAVLYQTRLLAVHGMLHCMQRHCTTQDYLQYMGCCIVCSGTVPHKTTCSTWDAAFYAAALYHTRLPAVHGRLQHCDDLEGIIIKSYCAS